ncbi:MAG TPA: hypothetical protein VGE06_09990 [Flavisolibacter sp.]
MEEKQLSEQESLHLIQQMITMAKKEQRDDGRGWIIWGWLLFLASMLTVANIRFGWFGIFFFWNAFGVFSLLMFVYESFAKRFFNRGVRVKTYTGDLFSRLNTGFFICLVFIIVALNVGSREIIEKYGVMDLTFINIGFALLINLYAFWVLIYGTALNFRPSIIAAYCTWAIGLVALFVQDFEKVMLLHALAVFAGYILPGHIANREFNRIKREERVTERV